MLDKLLGKHNAKICEQCRNLAYLKFRELLLGNFNLRSINQVTNPLSRKRKKVTHFFQNDSKTFVIVGIELLVALQSTNEHWRSV